MNKEDCIVGMRVAVLVSGDFELDNKIVYAIIKAPPRSVGHSVKTSIVDTNVEDIWIDGNGNTQVSLYPSSYYLENLMTEAEGKAVEDSMKIKHAALEDEFTAIKKQVLVKAAAAATLIEEANKLLAGNRELSSVGDSVIYKLQSSIRDAGWCTSDHNC